MTAITHDPEVQALLDVWAAVRSWLGRSWRYCRRALFWRIAGVGALALVWSLLWLFARPGFDSYPKPKVTISQATDATSGVEVSRQEWTDRALAS
jgi:hypothetical protein